MNTVHGLVFDDAQANSTSLLTYSEQSLADIHGFRSTLYEDIAREIFGSDMGVYFCTDTL